MPIAFLLLLLLAALPARAGTMAYMYQSPQGLAEVYETDLYRYQPPPLMWRSTAVSVPTRHADWMSDGPPPFYHTANRSVGNLAAGTQPVTVYRRTVRHVYHRPGDENWDTRTFWSRTSEANPCTCSRQLAAGKNPRSAPQTTARTPRNLDSDNLPYCK